MRDPSMMTVEELLRVVRFGKPTTDVQLEHSNSCFAELGKRKAADPAAFTEASKKVGWDG